MITRRFMGTLVAGTALVLAVPVAIAEAPRSVPNGAEPAVPPSAARTEAPKPNHPEPPATPASPRFASTTGPKHEPTPKLDSGRDHGPPENSGHGSEDEAHGRPGGEPSDVPSSNSGPDSTHVLPAEPGNAPTDTPLEQLGSDAQPEPSTDGPGAPTPEPPDQSLGVSSPPENGQPQCSITSAGLICAGDPDCVVTTAGVTCASNCTLTSVGLSCPRGDVGPNPRVEVLSNPPVSGRRERPGEQVSPERESGVTPENVADVQEADEKPSTGAGPLPFTGLPPLLPFGIGSALLAGGMLLRRTRSAVPRGAALGAGEVPRAAVPDEPPRAPRQPSLGAILFQSAMLVACGLLLRRWIGR